MPAEPAVKRTITFFDGQNLFHTAKYAFGYSWPNYDPLKLAQAVCEAQGWQLLKICLYTGLPRPDDDVFWHHFRTAELTQMGRIEPRVLRRRRHRYRLMQRPRDRLRAELQKT